ncbi:hypothetical protein [Cellulophaga sp. BC115SP]|uniref:hypothetical protein n=1 Tax=Cellulophaga sp. BC115SP TaxID=2683263 RepID=UPI001412612C|nr:hypothetical protein [Cellulophaga sp. BC115SP]NBB31799.1 hypothetical protein [Cellulophaga sp. BC115SP]
MQAITSLLSSLFGSGTDTTDAEMQQRTTILEQNIAKQKVTNFILYGLVLILGIATIVSAIRKK